MSFNVNAFSDAKLDELLTRITKIPEWELKNTQTARENKRIRQIQIHLRRIKQAENEAQHEKIKQQVRHKKSDEHIHEKDDGPEM